VQVVANGVELQGFFYFLKIFIISNVCGSFS